MRIAFLLCSALIGAVLLTGQDKSADHCPQETDRYNLVFVKSAFESFKSPGVWGFQIHQFNNGSPGLPQLGDAVSVGVLKLYGVNELVIAENTRSYLTLVVYSFSDRGRVIEKSDQEPRITSAVLDFIEQRGSLDPTLRKKIAYVRGCTKDFSCSFRNEGEFIKSH